MKNKKRPTIEYGPEFTHGRGKYRWVENASEGLRRVGFADELLPRTIRHQGWFTDDDGFGDTFRGVVYRLPGRGGLEGLFIYGYADPNNEDCAVLCSDRFTCRKEDAARWADQVAESFAEVERDYQRAWQASQRYTDLGDEVQSMRREALAIGAEMRTARKAHVEAPTICATLRDKIKSLYSEIQKARKQRAELFRDFHKQPGWEA